MNGYGDTESSVPRTHIPAGWDYWYGLAAGWYYNFTLNENGRLTRYYSNPSDYSTDVFSTKAAEALNQLLNRGQPFFLNVNPISPHITNRIDPEFPTPPTPAPRHAQLFEGLAAPRSGSFNELDVSDKPDHISKNPLFSEADIFWIDRNYRARAQTLQAADELISSLISRLSAASVLDSTFIILTSDNGFFFGDHRIKHGKAELYDPSTRVPLLISGPNVRAGNRRTETITNLDIFPTIADLAFATPPLEVDGRSFAAMLFSDSHQIVGARKGFLRYEFDRGVGLRLPSYNYSEHYSRVDGHVIWREIYDLKVDPDETRNLASQLTAESIQNLTRYMSPESVTPRSSCAAKLLI